MRFLMKITKSAILCILSLTSATSISYAAEVPLGSKLAKNQVFNRGNGAEPKTLDPQKSEETSGAHIVRDLFEGLTTEDARGNIIPGQAESWSLSSNGLVYTFKLRSNAKWSNGEPVTADDFVYGYQRVVDPKVASTYSFILSPIKNADLVVEGKLPVNALGVQALDKRTVEITLKNPTPYFLDIAALINTVPAHRPSIEKHKDKFTQPVKLISNGPYLLQNWKVGDKITLVRNPHYWNNSKTVIETVHFYPTESVNTEMQMYLSGQLDWTFNIPADQFKRLKNEIKDEVKTSPYLSIYYLNLNLDNIKFKHNIKLRQALSMAIDRDIIAKVVMGRGETPAYDFVPKGTKNYEQNTYDWQTLPTEKRIEKAQQLFKEAGYSLTQPLELNFLYNTNEINKKIAITLASMWQKNLNIKVTLRNEEWKVFLMDRHQGNYEITRNGWVGDYNDASSFISLLSSTNPQNISRYKNKKYDELLEIAATEQNMQKRKSLLIQLSKIGMDDYSLIPLFSYVTTHLVKPYVGGYCVTNALDRVLTSHLYILER